MNKKNHLKFGVIASCMLLIFVLSAQQSSAQVKLLSEVKITDEALYFDGEKNQQSTSDDVSTPYDYAYGPSITPHGDCIKTYKDYVFMTWYRGGKEDRHVMLTRYNTTTGSMKTIEFPHQHTGLSGKWWIGETHNTIAIGISPLNGTIHLTYDMHAYSNSGSFTNDYFRYSYSHINVADLPDDEFTLDKFVKDSNDGDYRHCTMNGVRDADNFSRMTYPEFFLNDQGELFLKMRKGSSYDGGMVFIKYNQAEEKWDKFKFITAMGAQSKGETHDWSIYGNLKFCNGKMRLGFQRRLRDGTDKYQYQNGVYYACCDDPTGASQWKNPYGDEMTFPLVKAEEVLVFEPGDFVETTQKNMIHIVSGFDFEVTDNGDEHIVSQVKDKENNITKKLHTYRKAGDDEFTTVEYDAGSELYAAGNNIYVIGLKNGRANIVTTEGGTSHFNQVYQHSSGNTYDKGVVHISDGKLYYYLKEAGGSGDTRTTYLQVFDLGISEIQEPDSTNILEFKDLNYGQIIEQGSDLTIEANVGTAYTEVSLFVGDTNLGTLSQGPFVWSTHPILSNMTDESYTFSLVAKDSINETVIKYITIYTSSDNGFLGEGVYKIYNPNKSKWLAYDNSLDDLYVTDDYTQGINDFTIIANGDHYNMYTNNKQKVVIINSATGYTSMLGDPTSDILNSGDALFTMNETSLGSELYVLTSGTVDAGSGKNYNLNVKSSGSDVGRGTSALDNYQWQFTCLGDATSNKELANSNNTIRVYPNPADECFFIEGADVHHAKVYTISGQLIRDFDIDSNMVDVRELENGIYFLQLESFDGQLFSERVFVQ